MNSDSTEGAGMIEALTWLEVNKKRLAIGAVVLLAVGFGIYVFNYLSEQKEVNASAALLELRPTGPSTNQTPVPSSDYLKVAKEHQGTAAAERAQLLAAGALFTEGKYADARAQFDNVIRSYPSSAWAGEAAFGIAASLEAEGKRDEALTAYQRVTTTYGSEPVATPSRMAIARIYEAKGQFDQALKQYEDITRAASASAMGMGMSKTAQEAFMAREELLKKHPELAPKPTNAPPVMMPASMPTNMPAVKAVTNSPATNMIKAATTAPAANSAKTNK
jgi:tetratricopeptide (TPR) repeat protein